LILTNSLEIGVGLAAPQRILLGSGRFSALGGPGRLGFQLSSSIRVASPSCFPLLAAQPALLYPGIFFSFVCMSRGSQS